MIENYELNVRCTNCGKTGTLIIKQGLEFSNSFGPLKARIGQFPNSYRPTCQGCGGSFLVKEKGMNESLAVWK